MIRPSEIARGLGTQGQAPRGEGVSFLLFGRMGGRGRGKREGRKDAHCQNVPEDRNPQESLQNRSDSLYQEPNQNRTTVSFLARCDGGR